MIKSNPFHDHNGNLKDINRYLTKDIIKNKIEYSENGYNLKLKKLYEDVLTQNPQPENMPNYAGIKSQLYIKLKKNLPKDIDKLSNIDKESGYFKTLYGVKFVIYNDDNVIILQSNIQLK